MNTVSENNSVRQEKYVNVMNSIEFTTNLDGNKIQVRQNY